MASATSRVRRCHVPGLSQLRSSVGAAARMDGSEDEDVDEDEEVDEDEGEDKGTA
jgi:hypothetical protein